MKNKTDEIDINSIETIFDHDLTEEDSFSNSLNFS